MIPACRELRPGRHPLEPAGRRPAGRRAGRARPRAGARPSASSRPSRSTASKLEAYEALCAELGEKPADVALAWLLHNPVVTAPIIGPRTMEQLDGSLRALEIELIGRHHAAAGRDLARPRRRGARSLRLVAWPIDHRFRRMDGENADRDISVDLCSSASCFCLHIIQ